MVSIAILGGTAAANSFTSTADVTVSVVVVACTLPDAAGSRHLFTNSGAFIQLSELILQ